MEMKSVKSEIVYIGLLQLTDLHLTNQELLTRIGEYNAKLADFTKTMSAPFPAINERRIIPDEIFPLYKMLSEIVDQAYYLNGHQWFRLNMGTINYHFGYYEEKLPKDVLVLYEVKVSDKGNYEFHQHIKPTLISRYARKLREIMGGLKDSLSNFMSSITGYKNFLDETVTELQKNPELTDLEKRILSKLQASNCNNPSFSTTNSESNKDDLDNNNNNTNEVETPLSPQERRIVNKLNSSGFKYGEPRNEDDDSTSPSGTPKPSPREGN